jgi:hypothetical protein
LTSADREAVAEIVAAVSNSKKQGCLYFGICNHRLKIESAEAALKEALSAQGFEIKRLALAEREEGKEPPAYRVLISDPVGYFANANIGGPTLFLVHGLPELIRAETPPPARMEITYQKVLGTEEKARTETAPGRPWRAPVSQRLNYGREVFHRKAICALFWIDPETMSNLMNWSRDFWSFRSGTAQFAGEAVSVQFTLTTPGDADSPSGESGWQTKEPSTRWLGDLEEKLQQLVAYRHKSPPDENAVASLLLEIGRLRAQRHELQQGLEALHEAEEIFERLGNRRQTRNVKAWLCRLTKTAAACNALRKTSAAPSR